MTLLDFLGVILPHVPRQEWEQLCAQGLMLNHSRQAVSGEHRVRAGERYLHKLPETVEPDVNGDIQVLYEDEAIVVLNKPAPLPMHPGGRFNRNSLQYILNEVYHPQKPRPAHRLDGNTTGVVLVTRTRHFASHLQPQFAQGEVSKIYLAKALGHPATEIFSCDAPISAAPGELGARNVDPEEGLPARTEFKVLRKNADGTTLLEVRPLTGRTNQIRLHLWELGLPICGDPVYLPGKKFGEMQTLKPGAPPLCLHSWKIEFVHPLHRIRTEFIAPPPAWAGL
jgi:RluA family pseudouridine synthase